MVVAQQLDRFINLRFMKNMNTASDDLVFNTPLLGVKQDMTLTGSLVSSYIASELILRCTNFYTKDDLSEYSQIRVQAGYYNGISAIFQGKFIPPYLERPSPDSVTVFRILGVAFYDAYLSVYAEKEWSEYTTIKTVLSDCVATLKKKGIFGISLSFEMTDERLTQEIKAVGETTIRDVFALLTRMFVNLRIVIRGLAIIVYNEAEGKKVVHVIDRISSAIKQGASISVYAPWDPSISQGDVIRMSALFFRQGVGASLLGIKTVAGQKYSDFITTTVDFSFSTTKSNTMIVNAIPKDGVKSTLGGE